MNQEFEKRDQFLQKVGVVVLEIIGPALVMIIVGSLAFFLAEVVYGGALVGRAKWILALFVFAAVLISRISIDLGFERASMYGFILAGAAWFVLASLVQGSPLVLLFVLMFVWWSASRLTWDCTFIDRTRDATGQGMIDLAIDRVERYRKGAKRRVVIDEEPELATLAIDPDKNQDADPKNPWQMFVGIFLRRRQPNTPGLWAFYFLMAGLPIFGIGQLFLRMNDASAHSAAAFHFFCYMFGVLCLLMVSSLLGLHRYLSKNNAAIPVRVARHWIIAGVILALVILGITFWLPRPTPQFSVSNWLPKLLTRDRDPSDFSFGRDGQKKGDNTNINSGPSSRNNPEEKGDNESGNSGNKKSSKDQGQSGKGGNNPKSSSQEPGSKKSGGKHDQGKKEHSGSSQKSGGKKQSGQKSQGQKSGGKKSDSQKSKGQSSKNADKSESADSGKKQDSQKQGEQKDGSSEQSKSEQKSKSKKSQLSDPPKQRRSRPKKNKQSGGGGSSSNRSDANQQRDQDKKEKDSQKQKQSSGDQSNRSQSSLSQAFSFISNIIKWLIYIVLLALLVWFAWKYRNQLMPQLKSFLAELAEFWRRLWNRKPKKKMVDELPASTRGQAIRQPRFVDFANPFASGKARGWSPEQIVDYTFRALEAWARDQQVARHPEQTPNEFVKQTAEEYEPLADNMNVLADLYGKIAYSEIQITQENAFSLSRLWDQLASYHFLRPTTAAG